jgi:hypothetical protein
LARWLPGARAGPAGLDLRRACPLVGAGQPRLPAAEFFEKGTAAWTRMSHCT